MIEVIYKDKVYRVIKENKAVLTISRFLEVIEVKKNEVTFL